MTSPDVVNFVNFNQDFSCLSVGTRHGYKIYNCDPFGKCFSKPDGGIGIVEMLFCTSLIAVVGIGDQPALSPRRLKIMNTKRQSTICELTFPTAVLKVKLNRRRLIVVLEEQIYIYDIKNMKLLHTIETAPNPGAVCALSSSSENCFMVYPSAAPVSFGSHLNTPAAAAVATASANATSPSRTGELKIFDCNSLHPINVIGAHNGPLSVVALNNEGTLLATASEKGTIVRIFAVPSGEKLYQFRRGTYPSRIFSINFNLSSTMVCVSSATETVHIFKLSTPTSKHYVPDELTAATRKLSVSGAPDPEGSEDSPDEPTDDAVVESTTPPGEARPAPSNGTRRVSDIGGFFESKRQELGRRVTGYLPERVSNMWEAKTRDFASFKLPAQAGTKSVVALSNFSQHAYVVTGEGYFYQYAIDLENGGECELVKQYSLLDGGD